MCGKSKKVAFFYIYSTCMTIMQCVQAEEGEVKQYSWDKNRTTQDITRFTIDGLGESQKYSHPQIDNSCRWQKVLAAVVFSQNSTSSMPCLPSTVMGSWSTQIHMQCRPFYIYSIFSRIKQKLQLFELTKYVLFTKRHFYQAPMTVYTIELHVHLSSNFNSCSLRL